MPNNIETSIAVDTEEVTIDDNIYIKETYEDGTYAYKDQEGNVTSIYYPSGYTKITKLEDGDTLSFYDGGKIKSIESCNSHSSYTVLHDNGETYESNPQYDYKQINAQYYGENGNLEDATLSDGTEISYYENGYCEEIITDDEDVIKFNDNGQVTSIQSSGKHSSFSFDHANGEHWQSAAEDDYTQIEEQTWYDNGQIKSKDNFDDSYTSYYENGYIETYYGPDHDQIEFDENGNLTSIHASGKHSSYELQHANGETWKSDPQYDYTNTKQQKWQDGNLISTSVDVSNEEVEKLVKERAHWLCEEYIKATEKRLQEIKELNGKSKTQYVKNMFDRLGHGKIYDKYCLVGQLNALQDVCDSSGNLNSSYHNTTNCANFIANMKKNGYADCFSKNPTKENIHPGDMIFTPRDDKGNYHVVSVKEVYQDETGETHIIVNSFNNDGTREFQGNGQYTVFNTEKYMEKALYKELEEQNLWQQEQDNGQYIASNDETRQMDAEKYAEMNAYLTRGIENQTDMQLAEAVDEHDNITQTAPETSQQEIVNEQVETHAPQQEIVNEQVETSTPQQEIVNEQVETSTPQQEIVNEQVETHAPREEIVNEQVETSTSQQEIVNEQLDPSVPQQGNTTIENNISPEEKENNMTEQHTPENDGYRVEYYPNGNIKYEEWSDGTKNEYYENGTLKYAKHDNMTVDYYENGNYKRVDYNDGNITEYYENGNIKTAVYSEGDELSFNEQGELTYVKASGAYSSYNIPKGDNTEWISDPQYDYTQIQEQTFENGQPVEQIKFGEIKEENNNLAENTQDTYKEDIQELADISYQQEQHTPTNTTTSKSDEESEKFYNDKGILVFEQYPSGASKEYYENGYTKTYRAPAGDVIDFDEQGRPTHIQSSGKYNSYKITHANGETWESPILRNYTKIKEQTWENGKLKDITRFTKEERADNYNKYHNQNGQVITDDLPEASYDFADYTQNAPNPDAITKENQVDDANLKWYGNGQLAEEVLDSGLARKHSADGKLVSRTYTGNSDLSLMDKFKGKKAEENVSYTFYPNGHLKSQTNADGTTTTFEENEKLPQATTIKLPNGATIHYDAEGKMAAEELPDGRKITYSAKGNVESYEWPTGEKATYYETGETKSWQENNTETFYYPNGGVKQVNYNDGSQIKFDENGSPTYIKSSGKANKIIVKDANGNTFWESDQKYDYTKIQEQVFYDNGNIKYEKFTDGTKKYTHPNGLLKHQENPDGSKVDYYENGMLSKKTDKDGNETNYDKEGNQITEKSTHQKEENSDELADKTETKNNKKSHKSKSSNAEYHENGYIKTYNSPDGDVLEFDDRGNITHIQSSGKVSSYDIEHPNGEHWQSPAQYDYTKIEEQTYENGELKSQVDKQKEKEEKEEKEAREEERRRRREERKARRLARIAALKAMIAERYKAENETNSPMGIFQRHRQNDQQESQSPLMRWFKNKQSQNG